MARAARIPTLRPRIPTADVRRVKPPPKQADAELQTIDWRKLRADVIRDAGGRCQWPGCGRAERRMFADHKVERRDGGALLDRSNLWCLCGSHHARKTAAARAKRMAAPPDGAVQWR